MRAFSVSGRWDVIAEAEAADLKALTEVVLRIRGFRGYLAGLIQWRPDRGFHKSLV